MIKALIHEYAVIRGDLSEQYARDQLRDKILALMPKATETVEWGVQKRCYPLGTGTRFYEDDEESARRNAPKVIGDGAYVVSRVRTSYADIVTEWAEVTS